MSVSDKWNLGPSDPRIFENRAGSVDEVDSPEAAARIKTLEARAAHEAQIAAEYAKWLKQCEARIDERDNRIKALEEGLERIARHINPSLGDVRMSRQEAQEIARALLGGSNVSE